MVNIFFEKPWILLIIVLWTLPWKGVALWMAAQRKQTAWFIVLLVLNTMAILEIIYIFFFSKEKVAQNNVEGDRLVRRV